MGEKAVVVQDGVQKQLKGWGCPVVGGSRKKRRRRRRQGRAVSCSWKCGEVSDSLGWVGGGTYIQRGFGSLGTLAAAV